MESSASVTSPPRGRRAYAHGRKIHHIRFRVDGSIACHLFFIKTKTMKLRQLQQQAMQTAAASRQHTAATNTAAADDTDEPDSSALLNSHLQQLYRQGRLGDNPYIIHTQQLAQPPQPPPPPTRPAKPSQPQPPPPPPPRRFTRPPQPLTARIPTLRIDPGPFSDTFPGTAQQLAEAEPGRGQGGGGLGATRVEGGRRVALFESDCEWYLYPHQLTMAAEEAGKKSKKREKEEAEEDKEGESDGSSISGGAAEALVRSRSIRAR